MFRTANYFNDILEQNEISAEVRNEFIVDHLENDNRNQINLINNLDNELGKTAENFCVDSYRAEKEPIKDVENVLMNDNQKISKENQIINSKNKRKVKLLKKLDKEIKNCYVINYINEYRKKECEINKFITGRMQNDENKNNDIEIKLVNNENQINNLENNETKISNKSLRKIKLLEKLSEIKIKMNKINEIKKEENILINKLNAGILPDDNNDELKMIIDENVKNKLELRKLVNKIKINNTFIKNQQNSFGNYEKIELESFDDDHNNSSIVNTDLVAHLSARKYNKFEKCNLRLERNDQILNCKQLLCI